MQNDILLRLSTSNTGEQPIREVRDVLTNDVIGNVDVDPLGVNIN